MQLSPTVAVTRSNAAVTAVSSLVGVVGDVVAAASSRCWRGG